MNTHPSAHNHSITLAGTLYTVARLHSDVLLYCNGTLEDTLSYGSPEAAITAYNAQVAALEAVARYGKRTAQAFHDSVKRSLDKAFGRV